MSGTFAHWAAVASGARKGIHMLTMKDVQAFEAGAALVEKQIAADPPEADDPAGQMLAIIGPAFLRLCAALARERIQYAPPVEGQPK